MSFTKEDTQEKVISVIAKELNIPKENIRPEATFQDLGADSLDNANIILSLEDTFEIKIDDEKAETITTVSQAIDMLHQAREK